MATLLTEALQLLKIDVVALRADSTAILDYLKGLSDQGVTSVGFVQITGEELAAVVNHAQAIHTALQAMQ